MQYDIFKNKECFKLICGAGNEDIVEVEKLVALYSQAGCQFFDVCAKAEVIEAAKRGLKRSKVQENRYICISVGSESDQHFCKAEINTKECIQCAICQNICPQNAIDNFTVNKTKCIGCKKCINICPKNCIKLIKTKTDLKELLPPLIEKGLDCIEFHVQGDEDDILKRWQEINTLYNGTLSISINRAKLGDEELIELIKSMLAVRKPYTTIIQADGIPMSGGKDDYKTTLQSISTADLFVAQNLPAYIICSGGTNSKTAQLAKMLNIDIDGVAIGSFARKIVKEYVSRDDFFENEQVYSQALKIATELVDSIKEGLKD